MSDCFCWLKNVQNDGEPVNGVNKNIKIWKNFPFSCKYGELRLSLHFEHTVDPQVWNWQDIVQRIVPEKVLQSHFLTLRLSRQFCRLWKFPGRWIIDTAIFRPIGQSLLPFFGPARRQLWTIL